MTFSTLQRQPVFLDFHSASLLRRILKTSDENNHSQTYAFCTMPDHVHWLFKLIDGDLSQAVARVKGLYSQKSKSRVWQRGYLIMRFVKRKV
ncbi:transposase [Oceaniserpentilla sp. 4NH20-0058]|uniref:transposase n=1 Tax=Oceaniserpentilla sp. 4NH20-0058 TaxID=3127660 RepID=UPI00334026F4